jgi:hypothetical protein
METKKLIVVLLAALSVLTGCTGGKPSADGLVTVDVTASYPEKELILQDFLDVEYIPLETNDEFIVQADVQAVGRDMIIIRGQRSSGDIFIFDRNGKALRKINRKGQGGEEYTDITCITLDEENGELFVNDASAMKILVYDTDGKFRRSFAHQKDTRYRNVYSFGRENLICYDGTSGIWISDDVPKKHSFTIISKQDGSVTGEIFIPFEKNKSAMMMERGENGSISISIPSVDYPVIPCPDNLMLVELSSDTVYACSPDQRLTPFIARTPSIQSMEPEVFLFLSTVTGRYYFMETVKKEYDFAAQTGFPRTNLMYDRQEKAIYEFTVYNSDYSDKEPVYMAAKPVNREVATWEALEAFELVEALEKGRLKGRLKEIAAGLDEDSNPVLMLATHRK